MDQPAHPVGEKHIDLEWLDNSRDFTKTEGRMHQRLARAIGPRSIIRRACFRRSATRSGWDAAFESAARATLWTANSRNLSLLSDQRDYMATILGTNFTELVDALADCVSFLYYLFCLFHKLSFR